MPDTPLLRRHYDPSALLSAHPPKLKHPHKRLAFELACPPGARHGGPITVTQWPTAVLPATVEPAATAHTVLPGYYDYRAAGPGVWHVNFADPQLFVAYGSQLLAQDELQCVEHPVLGSVREALLSERLHAVTEQDLRPTPVLLANVERRCALATEPDLAAGRPDGLYGYRFACADAAVVRAALRVLEPPTITHLVAMAAPNGGRGPYFRRDLDLVLMTAFTAFNAAVGESRRAWPGAAVEIHTGFWGCGAFGGNRHAMVLLQLLAARLARVDRLVFHAFDAQGIADANTGIADLAEALQAGAPGEPLDALMERVADFDYQWGVSDGN
jgi:hypothetical protein